MASGLPVVGILEVDVSRTYRKNPPREVHDDKVFLLSRGTILHSPAIPAVTRDGKVVLSYCNEKGWARHETIVKHRAQCKQALHHDREFPLFPATSGWVTW